MSFDLAELSSILSDRRERLAEQSLREVLTDIAGKQQTNSRTWLFAYDGLAEKTRAGIKELTECYLQYCSDEATKFDLNLEALEQEVDQLIGSATKWMEKTASSGASFAPAAKEKMDKAKAIYLSSAKKGRVDGALFKTAATTGVTVNLSVPGSNNQIALQAGVAGDAQLNIGSNDQSLEGLAQIVEALTKIASVEGDLKKLADAVSELQKSKDPAKSKSLAKLVCDSFVEIGVKTGLKMTVDWLAQKYLGTSASMTGLPTIQV